MKQEKFTTPHEKRLLFEQLGLVYLEDCEVAFKDLDKYDWSSSQYYNDNKEEFSQIRQKYEDQLKKHHMADTFVAKNDHGMGFGLFAVQDIQKGELIGEYTGVLDKITPEYPLNEAKTQFSTDFAWDYPDQLDDAPELEINALKKGNELRFVNHSFTPNCQVEHTLIQNQWRLFFIAAQDIKKNQELFVDYGDDYWTNANRELILPE